MTLTPQDIPSRLGRGETIATVCSAADLSRSEFDRWWHDECRRRVPSGNGTRTVSGLTGEVRIERDRWGIPHVFAATDALLMEAVRES